jgi:hypothetical protein
LGVSFVPAGLQGDPPKGVVLRPLAPQLPRIDCELALAYRRDPGCDLVRLFVEAVNEAKTSRRPRKQRSA